MFVFTVKLNYLSLFTYYHLIVFNSYLVFNCMSIKYIQILIAIEILFWSEKLSSMNLINCNVLYM